MKRLLLLCSIVGFALTATAQNPYITTQGAQEVGNGIQITEARTTLAVDLRVEEQRILAGPYARYAQKYLGVRAPLTDKTEFRIVDAQVGIVPESEAFGVAALKADEHQELQHALGGDEFSKFQVDKRDKQVLSLEEQAAAAARTIFSLRNNRIDLITGVSGENVFGAGLKAALDEIARLEQAYLELFLGKQITVAHSERYILTPQSSKKQYVVCRFSAQQGLLPESDLSGDMILMQIEPSGNIQDEELRASEKESSVVTCRMADPSTCIVMSSQGELARVVLPIYEFGRTVRVAAPRRK